MVWHIWSLQMYITRLVIYYTVVCIILLKGHVLTKHYPSFFNFAEELRDTKGPLPVPIFDLREENISMSIPVAVVIGTQVHLIRALAHGILCNPLACFVFSRKRQTSRNQIQPRRQYASSCSSLNVMCCYCQPTFSCTCTTSIADRSDLGEGECRPSRRCVISVAERRHPKCGQKSGHSSATDIRTTV